MKSLPADTVSLGQPGSAWVMKRRRENAELVRFEIDNVKHFTEALAMLDPDWQRDGRLKMRVMDSLKNAMYPGCAGQITNGEEKEITMSQIALELGFEFRKGI